MDLSIIIPAKNEPYLQQTIDDVFYKAKNDIEVIVILDGYWPVPQLITRDHLVIVHKGRSHGMRSAINTGASLVKGKYLLKCDAHCAFESDFDEKLVRASGKDMLQVPRRYILNPEAWDRTEKYYDFEYIEKDTLKGRKWPEYANRIDGQKLPDLMTFQGSCWFMEKALFEKIGGLDEKNYGGMGREAQEVCLKVWLSGGSCVRNLDTWYAHWNKPGKFVLKSKEEKQKSEARAKEIWLNDAWPGAVRKLDWLIEKFKPVPGWHQ